jgi:hypothetical protein
MSPSSFLAVPFLPKDNAAIPTKLIESASVAGEFEPASEFWNTAGWTTG